MAFPRLTTCRKTLFRTIALAILTFASLAASAVGHDKDDLIGTWTFTKVLDSSEIASIDDAEAAALVGTTLVIAADKVTVAGTGCRKPPSFRRHYEDAARYIRETAHAPVGRLGIPTTVEAVDLTCTEVLLKSHDKVVVYWQGFFFDAVKQTPKP